MSVAQLNDQLCFALYSASNHLSSIYRSLLQPLDLTYTQFIVMMALWEEDDISITRLAKTTGLSGATMTPLLKRLEQKKLILREVQPQNERQKNIKLTNMGRELSLRSGDLTKKAFHATGLSKKQAAEIIDLCHHLVNNSSTGNGSIVV